MKDKQHTVKMSGRLLVVMALHALRLAKDLDEQKESKAPLEVSGFDQPYPFRSDKESDDLIAQLKAFGMQPFDHAAIDLLIRGDLS